MAKVRINWKPKTTKKMDRLLKLKSELMRDMTTALTKLSNGRDIEVGEIETFDSGSRFGAHTTFDLVRREVAVRFAVVGEGLFFSVDVPTWADHPQKLRDKPFVLVGLSLLKQLVVRWKTRHKLSFGPISPLRIAKVANVGGFTGFTMFAGANLK